MAARRAVELLAVLATLTARGAAAQTSRADPTDVQSRVGTEVTVDLPDRWKASLQYQFRMVGDVSQYRGSYVSAEVTRGLGSAFTLLGNYRLALVDRGTYHRFGLGAEVEGKVGKVRLSFRPQFQFQRQHFDEDDDFGSDDDGYLRARGWAKLPLSEALSLYGGVEPHFKLGADYPVDSWRNTVGLEYKIAKRATVDAFYVFRPDYSKSYNRTFHIVGMEVEWDVKLPKGAAKAGTSR